MITLLPDMASKDVGEGHIGWFSTRQEKIKEIITQLKPLRLSEIGFHMGYSCKLICDTILETKKKDENYKDRINFYIFDICLYPHVEPNFSIMQKYYKDKNIQLQLIKGSSLITVEPFMKNHDNNFDFIEIDGSHTTEDVKTDILNTYHKIRNGGIIYIDDYKSTEIPSVGVENGVNSINWDEYVTKHIDGVFWGIKKF
jgi:hypothetical protein